MLVAKLALLIVAVVLFILAGLNVGHPRANLMALGLAAFAGAQLVP